MHLNFIQRINLLVYAVIIIGVVFLFLPMTNSDGFIGHYSILQRIDSNNNSTAELPDEEFWAQVGAAKRLSSANTRIDFTRLSIMFAGVTIFSAIIHLVFSGQIEPKKPKQ